MSSSFPFRSSDTLFGILAQILFLLEDEERFYITCSVWKLNLVA